MTIMKDDGDTTNIFQECGDASLLACGCLCPMDLASLSASCHRLHSAARVRLTKICASQLPLSLGSIGRSNYLVEFVRRHSLENKSALINHCIRVTKEADLLHMCMSLFGQTKNQGATDFSSRRPWRGGCSRITR